MKNNVSKHQQECFEAYENFVQEYDIKQEVEHAVWDFTFKRPEKPPIKTIANFGLERSKRKFPYYSKDFIRDMEQKEGTEEYIKFVAEEWRRRYEGYWFFNGDNLEYITGHHYCMLQYFLITVEINGRNVRTNPRFRDSHRDLFYALETTRNDKNSFGIVYYSFRRTGKTIVALAEGYFDTTENKESVFAIQSKTEDDGRKVFKKLVDSWQKIPSWFKPVDTGETTVTKRLFFGEKKKKQEGEKEYREVLNSEIFYINAKEEALDGTYCSFIFDDEVGKVGKGLDVNERWNINRECLVSGSKIVGKSIQTSTIEDMEKYGSDKALILWNRSNPNKRLPNNRTDSGLYRLFMPAYYGYDGEHPDTEEPFIDEFGYSNIKLAKSYIESMYKSLTGDDLLSFRRKYPITIDDCFALTSSDNTFDQKKIYEQEQFNKTTDGKLVTRGTFYWKDGIKDTEVLFKPSENGKWLVAWMPPAEDRCRFEIKNGQRRPTRDFCKTGCDPFSHRETVDKGSRGASATILQKHYSEPDLKMAFVCLYLARPKHPHEFAEDMIMQSVFYSSPFLSESNKFGVLDYFHKRGYDGFCLYNPLDPNYMKEWAKGKRGVPTTGSDIREALISMTQAYIMDYIGKNEETEEHGFCPFDEILEDWRKFEPDNWTPYDAFVATALALMATKKPLNKITTTYAKVTDWLPKFSQRGKMSVRI